MNDIKKYYVDVALYNELQRKYDDLAEAYACLEEEIESSRAYDPERREGMEKSIELIQKMVIVTLFRLIDLQEARAIRNERQWGE